VYPNPVVETLDVEVQGLSVPARLALYDINGQLQEQWRAAPIDGVGTLKANVGALAEGLYILSVETSEGVIHRQRVLKQR
jgi:hypothetical protein